MAEFSIDLRDIKFALLEHGGFEKLLALPKHKELDLDTTNAILDEAAKFCKEQIAPLNKQADRQGAVYDPKTSAVRVPESYHQAWKLFCENGWLSFCNSPEWGGQGMPYTLDIAIRDIFFGGCLAFNLQALLTTGSAHLIETFGNAAVKKTYLPNMYSGKWTGTMCLTEPGAGSDVGAARTKAKKQGDHYLIEGEKIFISFGEQNLTENIVHAVLARIEGAPAGTRGLSLFIVPKVLVNADGSLGERNDVRCTGVEHKMGIHGSPTCSLVFGERSGCKGYLIGEENKGMRAMFQMMNEARIMVGQQGASLANAAYQYALQFAKERVQSKDLRNRDDNAKAVPIVNHPDVRRMLMWQKAWSEGLRALLIRTGLYADLSLGAESKEEREKNNGLFELLTPVCKAYASDMGFRSTELSVQTLGGYGYISEYPVEQYLRDNKIASIYEGTNGIQALDLVGRKLPANGGASMRTFVGMLMELEAKNKNHPALAREVTLLGKARDALVDASMYFATIGAEHPELPALEAAPYLAVFGEVVLGWLLIEQALLAHTKLAAICKTKGVAMQERTALAKLCESDEDARYYMSKIMTATFYATHGLAATPAHAAMIKSGDRSALEAPL